MGLTFTLSDADRHLIDAIADRAVKLYASLDHREPKLDILMDITTVHANGCPLDLVGLLAADRGNFAHDIGGIRRHLDRVTGQLTDCFVPRYAMPKARA